MGRNVWIEIVKRVMSGEKEIVSPFSNEGKIESMFVVVQKDTKMGWGLIWCSKTHRGLHLSRIKIPETVVSVFTDEANLDHVPKISFESIT